MLHYRVQDWFFCGYIFGILAVLWSFVILYHAVENRNIKEFWITTGNSGQERFCFNATPVMFLSPMI